MKAIYIRVSTKEQNTERQEVEGVKMYIDKISGTIPFTERPQAKKLIKEIEKGKINYVEISSIDRLGRNLLDILNTIEFLKKYNCQLKIKNLAIEMLDENNKTTLSFNLISSIFGTIAEMERDLILERQREGVAIAKAKGVYKGRKEGSKESTEQFMEKHKDVIKRLKKGTSIRDVAEITKKSTATIQKVLKVMKEQEKEKENKEIIKKTNRKPITNNLDQYEKKII